MTLKLGYWKIRGMGEPIKLLLEYLEVPYEWKEYTPKNAQDWFENDKVNLGIEFPNLPYLIDGEFKTAQTQTIMKYLGKDNKYEPARVEEFRFSLVRNRRFLIVFLRQKRSNPLRGNCRFLRYFVIILL